MFAPDTPVQSYTAHVVVLQGAYSRIRTGIGSNKAGEAHYSLALYYIARVGSQCGLCVYSDIDSYIDIC